MNRYKWPKRFISRLCLLIWRLIWEPILNDIHGFWGQIQKREACHLTCQMSLIHFAKSSIFQKSLFSAKSSGFDHFWILKMKHCQPLGCRLSNRLDRPKWCLIFWAGWMPQNIGKHSVWEFWKKNIKRIHGFWLSSTCAKPLPPQANFFTIWGDGVRVIIASFWPLSWAMVIHSKESIHFNKKEVASQSQ